MDRQRFLATFKAEADGYVTALNRGLVELERTPQNLSLLSELFRTAHTLKGAARMMGFNSIRDIAHKIEDLFSLLKSGQLSFTAALADPVFKGLDRIQAALEALA